MQASAHGRKVLEDVVNGKESEGGSLATSARYYKKVMTRIKSHGDGWPRKEML